MKSTLKQIKEHYATLQWYKQGAAVRPWYVGYPIKACVGFTVEGKTQPMSYEPFGIYIKDDFFDVYFSRHTMEQASAYYLQREKKHPDFIKKLGN